MSFRSGTVKDFSGFDNKDIRPKTVRTIDTCTDFLTVKKNAVINNLDANSINTSQLTVNGQLTTTETTVIDLNGLITINNQVYVLTIEELEEQLAQAAITGGTSITVAPGLFIVSSNLKIPKDTDLRGSGFNTTIFRARDGFSDAAMFTICDDSESFSDCTIDGNNGVPILLEIDTGTNVDIQNIKFERTSQSMLSITDSSDNVNVRNTFYENKRDSQNSAITIANSTNVMCLGGQITGVLNTTNAPVDNQAGVFISVTDSSFVTISDFGMNNTGTVTTLQRSVVGCRATSGSTMRNLKLLNLEITDITTEDGSAIAAYGAAVGLGTVARNIIIQNVRISDFTISNGATARDLVYTVATEDLMYNNIQIRDITTGLSTSRGVNLTDSRTVSIANSSMDTVGVTGMYASNASDVRMTNIEINDPSQGILVEDCNNWSITNTRVFSPAVSGACVHITDTGGIGSDNIRVTNCEFDMDGVSWFNVIVDGAENVSFENTVFANAGFDNLRLSQANNIAVSNCNFSRTGITSTTRQLLIGDSSATGGVNNVKISGCNITDVGQTVGLTLVEMFDADDVTITGCTLQSSEELITMTRSNGAIIADCNFGDADMGIQLTNSNELTVNNSTFNLDQEGVVFVGNTSGISFNGCEFIGTGSVSTGFQGSPLTIPEVYNFISSDGNITNCKFLNLANAFIFVGLRNFTIGQNVFSGGGTTEDTIWGDNITISGNTYKDRRRGYRNVGNVVQNLVFSNNIFSNIAGRGLLLSRSTVVFPDEKNENINLSGNLFEDAGNDQGNAGVGSSEFGILDFSASEKVNIVGNVFRNCGTICIRQDASNAPSIRNEGILIQGNVGFDNARENAVVTKGLGASYNIVNVLGNLGRNDFTETRVINSNPSILITGTVSGSGTFVTGTGTEFFDELRLYDMVAIGALPRTTRVTEIGSDTFFIADDSQTVAAGQEVRKLSSAINGFADKFIMSTTGNNGPHESHIISLTKGSMGHKIYIELENHAADGTNSAADVILNFRDDPGGTFLGQEQDSWFERPYSTLRFSKSKQWCVLEWSGSEWKLASPLQDWNHIRVPNITILLPDSDLVDLSAPFPPEVVPQTRRLGDPSGTVEVRDGSTLKGNTIRVWDQLQQEREYGNDQTGLGDVIVVGGVEMTVVYPISQVGFVGSFVGAPTLPSDITRKTNGNIIPNLDLIDLDTANLANSNGTAGHELILPNLNSRFAGHTLTVRFGPDTYGGVSPNCDVHIEVDSPGINIPGLASYSSNVVLDANNDLVCFEWTGATWNVKGFSGATVN